MSTKNVRAKHLAARIKASNDKEQITKIVLQDLVDYAIALRHDVHASTQEEINEAYERANLKWIAVYYELNKGVDINAFKKFVVDHIPHRATRLGWASISFNGK